MIQALKKSARKIFSMFSRANSDYSSRVVSEIKAYENCENVHDLPQIFHYWSNKHLLPMMQKFGITSPDEFFYSYLEKLCLKSSDYPVRIVSIGAGNCDLEVKLARQLRDSGNSNFQIECIDLNPGMLDRGAKAARDSEVEKFLRYSQTDFNLWVPQTGVYDAVMANQSLHHVMQLEHLFNSVRLGLKPGGLS